MSFLRGSDAEKIASIIVRAARLQNELSPEKLLN